MARNITHKNENIKSHIDILRRSHIENKTPAWKKLADDLSRPSRKMKIVNIYKIEKYARNGEIVVVPGKVLGEGELTKKIDVAAYQFSESAKQKILKVGKVLTIPELLKTRKKAENVRILG